MNPEKYFVALRREHCESAPEDWLDRLRRIDGVEFLEFSSEFDLATVLATEAAIRSAREELSRWCIIEAEARHYPQA